jgi:hypothetical protein
MRPEEKGNLARESSLLLGPKHKVSQLPGDQIIALFLLFGLFLFVTCFIDSLLKFYAIINVLSLHRFLNLSQLP